MGSVVPGCQIRAAFGVWQGKKALIHSYRTSHSYPPAARSNQATAGVLFVMQGSGGVRAGQWSRGLCLGEGLATGSILPLVAYAQARGHGVRGVPCCVLRGYWHVVMLAAMSVS